MSTPEQISSLTLSASDIAHLARVGKSTVSNWRQRHNDFPKPVSGEGTRLRYDASEVHSWLQAHGKEVRGLSSDQVLWSVLDEWRGQVNPENGGLVIADLVTWRFVSDPASPGFEEALPAQAQWLGATQRGQRGDVWDQLEAGMEAYEGLHPEWAPIFVTPDLRRDGQITGLLDEQYLWPAIDAVNSLDASQLREAFTSLHDRITRTGKRGYDEHATSDTLVNLIATVAASIPGPVHDPVVGSGRMLMAAASRGQRRSMLTGQDVNASACIQAKQRALLAGHTNVSIRHGDTLQADLFAPGLAQVVVMDPPYGLDRRGTGDLHLDPRLTYGTPPKSSVDLAWLQLGVWYLGPNGRAFILQPPGSAFRGSSAEVAIRTAMLRAGTIEAVVALPAGLASHTQIPLYLWVLARPGESADPTRVLMVDQSASTSVDPDAIAAALQQWRDDQTISANLDAHAVAVADILADKANLTPRRWLGAQSAELPGVDEVRAAVETLHSAVANIQQPTKLTAELVKSGNQAPRTVTLTELQKTEVLEVVRAAGKVRESDYSAEGTPVVTGAWIRGSEDTSRKLDLSRFDEELVITRPGDVLLQNTGGLAARVDTEGGRVLTSHNFHLLRIHGEALNPEYLAELLVSTQNRNQAQGATIQRVRLQDMTIRMLPRTQQDQLIERLGELRALAASADAILQAAGTTRQHLVDAITAGTVDVT